MRAFGGLVFCLLSGAVLAQAPAPAPAPAAPPDPLTGSAGLGYLSTSGNTDSTNANALFKATWDLDGPWKHDWNALAISARTNGVTTAESYSAGYKAQRDLSPKSYLFAAGDWRSDEFAGYDEQMSEAVGYGWRAVDTERHTLSLDGGAGAKQSTLIDGTELDEAIVRGGLDYLLHISDSAELSQKLLLEQGDDNRYTESTTALKARLIGDLALVLSFVIKNNSDVPVGIEKTDRFTSISLEYGF
jgi:putative salt-induced outer membrane protein